MSRGLVFGALFCGVLLAFAACIFPPEDNNSVSGAGGTRGPTGGKVGAGGAGGAGGDGGAGSKDASPEGTTCVVATSLGTNLCEGVSTCKGLQVNQNSWNGCGFTVLGKSFALSCECMGYLCSGPPTPTCAAAESVLSRGTAAEVCGQLDDGGCSDELLGGADSGPGKQKCNTDCASQCVGDPSCLTGCGC